MNICVIGSGYVGLVTGTCLAELGNKVICVDIDKEKIDLLNKGKVPIYEKGLEKLIKKNVKKKRLFFTTDIIDALEQSYIIFVAVGTPTNNGVAELKYVTAVIDDIANNVNSEKIIVIKSTVPVGTARTIEERIKQTNNNSALLIVSNPEFLREGNAVYDFMNADRIVIGTKHNKAKNTMKDLYKKLKTQILFTDNESAELIKYASNAFLASKISFINEIAKLCEKTGANIKTVAKGIGLDKRIGKEFLNAGIGYGGSCFSKDIKALLNIGIKHNIELKIPKVIEEINEEQKTILIEKLEHIFSNLKGKNIALLGLAFKPETDDIRDAPSLRIIEELIKRNVTINAYDPIAMSNIKKLYPNINLFNSPYDALNNADALLLVTEWNEFKRLDFKRIKRLMKTPIVLDGRNALKGEKLKDLGFNYIGIGVR